MRPPESGGSAAAKPAVQTDQVINRTGPDGTVRGHGNVDPVSRKPLAREKRQGDQRKMEQFRCAHQQRDAKTRSIRSAGGMRRQDHGERDDKMAQTEMGPGNAEPRQPLASEGGCHTISLTGLRRRTGENVHAVRRRCLPMNLLDFIPALNVSENRSGVSNTRLGCVCHHL